MIDDEDLQNLKDDLKEIFTEDPKELQKKYQAEHEEKLNKHLAPFKHLWKIDDKEWGKQRREVWRVIEENFLAEGWSKAEVGRCKRYFLKGVKKEYMSGATLYFLTPIDSPETALKFFLSTNLDRSMRDSVCVSYFESISGHIEKLPSLRPIIKYYADGVLGRQYKNQISDNETGRTYDFRDPTYWCESFIWACLGVIKGEQAYSGYLECVDYFISCLRHVEKINKAEVEELLQLASSDDKSRSTFASELASEIREKQQKILDAIKDMPNAD